MLAAIAVAALVIGGVGATITVNQEAQDAAAQPTETVVEVRAADPVDTPDR